MILRIVLAYLLLGMFPAFAVECPPPPPNVAPGCKVITINPAEELSLIGPNNVLDAAAWARHMELDNVTRYWRDKIKDAPAGDPPNKPKE